MTSNRVPSAEPYTISTTRSWTVVLPFDPTVDEMIAMLQRLPADAVLEAMGTNNSDRRRLTFTLTTPIPSPIGAPDL